MAGYRDNIWITDETPARALFVAGRSGIDPDCLVAYLEGDETKKPYWIVDHGNEGHVCGLGVRARLVKTPPLSSPQEKTP